MEKTDNSPKNGLAEGESETALAKEILDPRDAFLNEKRKDQSPMLNILALLLVLVGIAALVFLYFYYFKGK